MTTAQPADGGMKRLGILVPSSNTALEPIVAGMLRGLPDVSAHFSRFPVTRIDLSPGGLAQFELPPILAAARLLADAEVDVICWNGTAAGWCGFDADRTLCAAIEAETGVPCVTSVLALNAALAAVGARSLGLVTPYTADVQARIVANYGALGLTCTAEHHLDLSRNFDFADVSPVRLDGCVRAAAAARPDAITVFCTNLKAADQVERWEAALRTPVFDTIATGLWHALAVAGASPERVAGWGSVFRLPFTGRATAEEDVPS